ncbi:MAG: serine acetyltransferase [Spirochaetales bacterium]|nr:serine acetyltransferase [Spirochaetales bacterium]
MKTIAALIDDLEESHRNRSRGLPSRQGTERFLDELLALLFPHFAYDERYGSSEEIAAALIRIERRLKHLLAPLEDRMEVTSEEGARAFLDHLPAVYELLREDAEAIYNGDPAAESVDEVVAAYPGFFAIAAYRVAHCFYRSGVPVFPRIITEYAHLRTGVDIHPGAEIGRAFFIDHATGIVIGETTTIGDHVKIYQGVTLGALSVSKEMHSTKRHPTIQDRVIVYSNATILGGDTVVGHDSIIGGNAWVTSSIEAYSVVYNRAEVHVRNTRSSDHEIVFHI